MDESGFRQFLKKGGRSEDVADRVVGLVSEFRQFLLDHFGKDLEGAQAGDLEAFVELVDQQGESSVKGYLWAIRYYYQFINNEALRGLASQLRHERIQRKPSLLRNFRGISADTAQKLESVRIRDIQQMLAAGNDNHSRAALAQKSGLPEETILELVKLSDLARITGVKGIRARLYYDAGLDTLDKLAANKKENILAVTREFVERTGFDGIPPLPAEVEFTIKKAKTLPRLVEY